MNRKAEKIIIGGLLLLALCSCSLKKDNGEDEIKKSNNVSLATTGKYLFNADKMETVEISGEDILRKKKAELSTEIITGEKVDFVIEDDFYHFGMSMLIRLGNVGMDMSWNLGKSVDGGVVPKEGFYYQMATYDFDHDGKKEIIIAGGNKKDILELRVFQLDTDSIDLVKKGEPPKSLDQSILRVDGGSKSYVNEKDEICVIDDKNNISVYPYKKSE